MAVVGLYLVRKSLDRATAGRVARAAVATIAMGLLVDVAAPLGLAVQVLLGLVVFAVLAVLLRLIRPHERALARRYAGAVQVRLARVLAR
jgi:hypothetical protein